jgi:hypothetical protein
VVPKYESFPGQISPMQQEAAIIFTNFRNAEEAAITRLL